MPVPDREAVRVVDLHLRRELGQLLDEQRRAVGRDGVERALRRAGRRGVADDGRRALAAGAAGRRAARAGRPCRTSASSAAGAGTSAGARSTGGGRAATSTAARRRHCCRYHRRRCRPAHRRRWRRPYLLRQRRPRQRPAGSAGGGCAAPSPTARAAGRPTVATVATVATRPRCRRSIHRCRSIQRRQQPRRRDLRSRCPVLRPAQHRSQAGLQGGPPESIAVARRSVVSSVPPARQWLVGSQTLC